MRSGVIAEKVGMMSLFQEKGTKIPVTVLKIDSTVVDVRTTERDGYVALQLGAGKAKNKNVAKPQLGHFAKAKVEPKQMLVEFRVTEDCVVPVGSELAASHFVVGQMVDVSGVSIGKGFAGVMKKYNFGGDNATHGVSRTHRAGGSTGNREWPGRVFKNRKMPGQMGNKASTAQNLEVVAVDADRNLIMVKGSVPGFDSGFVTITDAVKKTHKGLPMPAGLKASATPAPAEKPAEAPAAEAVTEAKE
ncbi:MAG: 50S ribosomal protein L3 [Lactobacillales bacterium]|jgi:large subunit ribosomal protein L3|nr:50S ribosomal protein L3 [Lactobacillales bacterium]